MNTFTLTSLERSATLIELRTLLKSSLHRSIKNAARDCLNRRQDLSTLIAGGPSLDAVGPSFTKLPFGDATNVEKIKENSGQDQVSRDILIHVIKTAIKSIPLVGPVASMLEIDAVQEFIADQLKFMACDSCDRFEDAEKLSKDIRTKIAEAAAHKKRKEEDEAKKAADNGDEKKNGPDDVKHQVNTEFARNMESRYNNRREKWAHFMVEHKKIKEKEKDRKIKHYQIAQNNEAIKVLQKCLGRTALISDGVFIDKMKLNQDPVRVFASLSILLDEALEVIALGIDNPNVVDFPVGDKLIHELNNLRQGTAPRKVDAGLSKKDRVVNDDDDDDDDADDDDDDY
jgi:hypothetical protein